MKRTVLWWLAAAGAPIIGGCPLEDIAPGSMELASGVYWVQGDSEQLALYDLPQTRGASGTWTSASGTNAGWFSGAGLYQSDGGGAWIRLTEDPGLTLDSVLQTHDPGPAPVEPVQ